MKKRTNSKVGNFISRIINIRFWFDWDRMKAFTLALNNGIKQLFIPQQAKANETFESAKSRLNLTEEELLIKKTALFRLSLLMVILAILILGYSGYQLFYGSIKAFIVSLAVTIIAVVLAFRYHFWYFQIEQRKLGCTFNEWYRKGLLGEKE